METEQGIRKITAVQGEEITIEISEYETVEMEWNGVTYTLYQGKPRPAAPAPAAKPAPVAKPAVRRVSAPVASAPKKVMPKRAPGSRANVKVKKGTGPKKALSADDGQHSIHTLSFEEKLAIVPKDTKKLYNDLSNYLITAYGCSHRTSFAMDAYRVGRELLVALSLGGEHIRVNGAIEPKFYKDSKMPVNSDKDVKHYADVPSYMKVGSEKTYKQALRFIDDVMKKHGVKKLVK